MAKYQERIKVGTFHEKQPTKFDYQFSTTQTNDSGRSQSGKARLSPLFTVEAFDVEYTELTAEEASKLLKIIVPRPNNVYFLLRYFSPYEGKWQERYFYVGAGSLKVKTLKVGNETMQSISCSFVGRDKIC